MASVEKRPHVKTEKMAEFMRTFSGPSDDPVSVQQKPLLRCPQEGCEKVLTSMPGLRYHLQTHMSTHRVFTCDRCKKTFKSSNGLKYHQLKSRCELSSSAADSSARSEVKSESITSPVSSSLATVSLVQDRVPQLNESYQSHAGRDHDEEARTLSLRPPLFRSMSLDSCQDNFAEEYHSGETEAFSTPPGGGGQSDWLTELAIIATSLERPLIDKPPDEKPKVRPSVRSSSLDIRCLHSYARPPLSRSSSPVPGDHKTSQSLSNFEDSDFRVSSSSPCPTSPQQCDQSGIWSHSWPTAVWQCFIKGTRIRFTSSEGSDWQMAEDLGRRESLTAKASQRQTSSSYAPNGLMLSHIEECQGSDRPEPYIRLRFGSDKITDPELIAECALDHPFFVKDKGWSSFHPSMTVEHYGIPCCELEVHDLCLPQGHPDATFDVDVFESFKSYDFTPMDSSAVFALSSMAMQRRDQELSPHKSPPPSPSKRRSPKSENTRAKRPMNAFMLFAKKFRMEYTHLYPGKDNRAISVLLGDKWKKMRLEERRVYSQEAKLLAEQHKRVNPDCWKRKRSLSGNF